MPVVESPGRWTASRAPLRCALVAWCALIFLLSSQPHLGTDLGALDVVLRKCAHVAEYAVLALLASMTLRQEGAGRRATLAGGWLLAVLYAGSDEWHQTFVRGRHGAPLDIVIDAGGALIGIAIARRLMKRRPSDAPTEVHDA